MARTISDEEIQLKRRARRRLIGAIVLVTAIVVALPMVLDTEPRPLTGEVSIKIPSPDSGEFTSRVVPVAPGTPPGDAKAPPASRLSTEMKSAPKVAAAPAEKPAPKAPPAAAPAAEKPAKTAKAEAPASSPKPAAQKASPPPKAAPPQKAGTGSFVVQVIALADAEKARHVQAQIAAAGIKAYTEVVKTAKGDVTRVRAGPFATRDAAEKARDQLKGIGFSGNVAAK